MVTSLSEPWVVVLAVAVCTWVEVSEETKDRFRLRREGPGEAAASLRVKEGRLVAMLSLSRRSVTSMVESIVLSLLFGVWCLYFDTRITVRGGG